MTGTHHLIAGMGAAGCLMASTLSYHMPSDWKSAIPIAGMAAGAIVGSIFPDIDTKTSMISKKMRIISAILRHMFSHRGFLHSPLFVALISLLCWWLFHRYNITDYTFIYVGFVAGLLNHLICDFCTKGGLPLLYPFSKHKFNVSSMHSGSKKEPYVLMFVCMCMFGIDLVLILRHIYINQLLKYLI